MTFVAVDHLGWLNCDGRELDQNVFALLFKVIGYTFGHGTVNTTFFKLPNPAGRVMGTVGTVTDDDARSRTYTAGDSVGELDHKLTVPEMPAHNHNKATASPGANTTSDGTTSVQADHTHSINDTGHSHGYTAPASEQISLQASTQSHSSATTSGATSTSTTGISILPAGAHSHTISSNGGDQYHNNIQPTLFYGNTFIYSGVPFGPLGYGGHFPFETGLSPVLI